MKKDGFFFKYIFQGEAENDPIETVQNNYKLFNFSSFKMHGLSSSVKPVTPFF